MRATLLSELMPIETLNKRDIFTRMDQRAERGAQRAWAAWPIEARLRVIKQARHLLAAKTDELCAAISPNLARNPADTRVAEILPLLAACKFLEVEAASVLAPRQLGRKHRPMWLSGVCSVVRRVPMGRVLVIAPSNYPLFLAGAQTLQALTAGNAVIWKPGVGGRQVALIVAEILRQAGLPEGLLQVTDESVEAARTAIDDGVDKVFFTGSVASGKALMHHLSETLTPCVMELSGCDAVFVLPTADLSRVAKALAFGMRLNGSATCMAPRRVFLIGADRTRRESFLLQTLAALGDVEGITLSQTSKQELHALVADAVNQGAELHGSFEASQHPFLLTGVRPEMQIASVDVFAPVLSMMEAASVDEAILMNDVCKFALTASVFGDEAEALGLVAKIDVGTVTINDLIVPTADPRMPFGGCRHSGFGVTRGAEGLLEMTSPKTIAVRHGKSKRHFDATTVEHEALFDGVIQASHGKTWKQRVTGISKIISAARKFTNKN